MAESFIPVNTPLLNGNEEKYLVECIRTGWISSEGPFVTQFEDTFAASVNRKYGIAVANGTSALDVAVKALGLGPGDEVILPTFTIISSILQIVRSGATPILVDSQVDSWNMDVSQIETKITERTKAILVVHIYGLPAEIETVLSLAKKYKLKVIEDAAQMHGQRYKGLPCGSFGDISTFSFYPNKLITTGEGGMVVTNNEELLYRCRSFRNLCFKEGKRFVHNELGWNYRMTNLQAAIGLAQLERIEEFIERKRAMGHFYQEAFRDLPFVQNPMSATSYAENIYWVYGLVLSNNKMENSYIVKELNNRGVGTRPFFCPMHMQPVFNREGFFNDETYPVSEHLYRNGFYIPSGLGLSKTEMERVVEAVQEVFIE